MPFSTRLLAAAGVLTAACLTQTPAHAQDFYAGKTVTMIIGFGPGGGYDLWGRTVARHIVRHLPGHPNSVPQNMPGAGSYHAANHIYNIAPKDGTVIGIIARDAALGPLTGAEGARFDPLKINWLGTPAVETNVCITRANSDVKTAKDLFEKTLIVGDTGAGTGTRTYPKVLTALLGMKFKVIAGFPSSSDVFLAMERGEVDGICESLDSVHGKRPDWIPQGKVRVLLQGGEEPNHELKDVPFVLDLARNEDEKQALSFAYAGQGIGRPFVAPPNLPPERLATLRKAFMDTMKDEEFKAEVKKQKLELEPQDGDHLEKLIKQIYATPKPIVAKIGEMMR